MLIIKSGLLTFAMLLAFLAPVLIGHYFGAKTLLAIVAIIAVGGMWRLNYSLLKSHD